MSRKVIKIMDCHNCTNYFCDHCATLKGLEAAGLLDEYTVIYGSDSSEEKTTQDTHDIRTEEET